MIVPPDDTPLCRAFHASSQAPNSELKISLLPLWYTCHQVLIGMFHQEKGKNHAYIVFSAQISQTCINNGCLNYLELYQHSHGA